MTVRVLFVTSDPVLGRWVTEQLAPHGLEVTTHDNLTGFYPLVLTLEPQVLLLDTDLPRLGLEASTKFLRGKGLSLPAILYSSQSSGEADDDPYKLVLLCNAQDFVEKTAPIESLRRVLSRAARKSGAMGAAATDSGELTDVITDDPAEKVVLVVDDERPIAYLLKKILETKYKVMVVNTGRDAVELCRLHDFVAIFCDLKMPGVSGPDVYRAILASKPAMAERVVFVTAHQLDTIEVEFFLGLKNQIVHKPFGMREILAVAQTVIG